MSEVQNLLTDGHQDANIQGVSIVELLIAMFMATILLSSALGLYMTQHNQLLVQEDVSEIQGNARATATILADEIRKAGYLLPSIVTPLEIMNTDPDTIIIKYATSKILGTYLIHDVTSRHDDLECIGNDLQELSPGDWLYIYDRIDNQGEAFVVSGVDYPNRTIEHDASPLGRRYPRGSQLNTIVRNKFYIDLTDSSNLNLMIERLGQQPEIYAENIENLDFTYHLVDCTISNELTNLDNVRMIGIDVTSKSQRPELNDTDGQYRSRNFSLRVKLRNFGID